MITSSNETACKVGRALSRHLGGLGWAVTASGGSTIDTYASVRCICTTPQLIGVPETFVVNSALARLGDKPIINSLFHHSRWPFGLPIHLLASVVAEGGSRTR